jgi:hypothetical protein
LCQLPGTSHPCDIADHESIRTTTRHGRFAHPADAAGGNLDCRELGRGRRLEPGLADDACFAVADPHGFFIGELEGEPAASLGNGAFPRSS